LWLLRGQSPAVVSGGLFTPETTVVEFTDRALVSRITGMAVTDEPAGGSKTPTGHKFLVGTPRT
jgi:anti-sigma-K factor RskA